MKVNEEHDSSDVGMKKPSSSVGGKTKNKVEIEWGNEKDAPGNFRTLPNVNLRSLWHAAFYYHEIETFCLHFVSAKIPKKKLSNFPII